MKKTLIIIAAVLCAAVAATFIATRSTSSSSEKEDESEVAVSNSDTGISVSSSEDGDITAEETEEGLKSTFTASVADGTLTSGGSGSVISLDVSGTTTTATEVSFKADLDMGDAWVLDGSDSFYCPLKITVGDTSYYASDYDSALEFEKAVEEAPATQLMQKDRFL